MNLKNVIKDAIKVIKDNVTPQREEIVSFSIPYDVAGQAVLVKSNSSINGRTSINSSCK